MLASCGDDIDSLNGEWSLISLIAEGSETGICDEQEYNYEFKSVGKNIEYIIMLNNGDFSGLGNY